MTDVMAILFVDVHQSIAKLTFFWDGNCLLIASTVSDYFVQQILLRVVVDGSIWSLCNALYDHCSSRFNTAFHGIWAKTNPNMMQPFHMSWWNLELSKSLAASLERFVCHLSQYGSNLDVEYEFPLRTYYCNSSTSLLLQDGQSWFIDHRTSQFSNFWLSQFVQLCDVSFCQPVFSHWAGPMFLWMVKNLMTNDTYDSRAACLLNSTM